MFAYLVRRIGISAVTLLIITFLVYGLIRNIPGTPLTVDAMQLDPSKQISGPDYERMKRAYGLDKPWPSAYVQWVMNLFRGDLGRSFRYKRPVTEVIGAHVGPTLLLSVTSLSLTYLLSIPLGLFASARNGKTDERILSTGLYMLYSFPSFVAALLLQILFFSKLRWLPLHGMTTSGVYETLSTWGKVWDIFQHALLPVVCFTYGSLAYYTRFIDSNMQEVVRQDYVRTAVAKGAGPFRVIVKHAFRNTLIPMVTLIGLTLPALLSGSIIIERIFSWPGMGQLFFDSIGSRDYPTIMGLTLMFSLLTLAGQLLADVLYVVVDPRVRLS